MFWAYFFVMASLGTPLAGRNQDAYISLKMTFTET